MTVKPARGLWHTGAMHPQWLRVLRGLRGGWLFHEGTGQHVGAIGRDRRDGTSQSPVWVPSSQGHTLDIDSLRARRIEAANFDPLITEEITVLAVVGAHAATEFRHIVSRHPAWFLTGKGSSSNQRVRFAVNAGGTEYIAGGFTDVADAPGVSVVVGRYDGAVVSVWVDGLKDAETSASGELSTSGQMRIGDYGESSNDDFAWPGIIGTVLVWSRALADDEIVALSRDPYGPFRAYDGPEVWAATAGQTVSVGTVTETTVAQPISASKLASVGTVTETTVAQPVSAERTVAVGTVTEASTAQPVSASKTQAVGQVAETTVAQPISAAKTQAVGTVTETTTAQAITATKTVTVGTVTEATTAQAVSAELGGATNVSVGTVSETTTAQPTSASKVQSVGTVSETTAAQPIGALKTVSVGQVSETATAQAISSLKTLAVGTVTETTVAQSISASLASLVTPAERTLAIDAEDRTRPVEAENRIVAIASENRTRAVEA